VSWLFGEPGLDELMPLAGSTDLLDLPLVPILPSHPNVASRYVSTNGIRVRFTVQSSLV
jgi:hypothetical protein